MMLQDWVKIIVYTWAQIQTFCKEPLENDVFLQEFILRKIHRNLASRKTP